MRCGTDTAATAVFVPACNAINGVSRLPMPKPETAATAPATVAHTNTIDSYKAVRLYVEGTG
jgi:hypothetical protein